MSFDIYRLPSYCMALLGYLLAFLLIYIFVAGQPYRDVVRHGASLILNQFEPLVTIRETEVTPGPGGHPIEYGGWKLNYYVAQSRTIGQAYQLTQSSLKGMFLSLALLPTLIFVTPVRWGERMKILGWSLLILTIAHIIALVLYAHLIGYYSIQVAIPDRTFWWRVGHYFWGIYKLIFTMQAALFSVAIWGFFCWKHVFGTVDETPAKASAVSSQITGEQSASEARPLATPAPQRTAARDKSTPPQGASPQAKAGAVASQRAISKNAPCPCGSGKKLKHCCGRTGG